MQRLIRAAMYCVLVASLAACVVTPPPPQPRPSRPPRVPTHPSPRAPERPPEHAAPPAPAPASKPPAPPSPGRERMQRIQERIDTLNRRIDDRVDAGYYPAVQGTALHRRLDVIRQESNDMSAQHGGSLSADEERVLNQELDTATRAIGE